MSDLVRLFVSGTIDLHAEFGRWTIEVEDIRTELMLTAEAEADLVSAEHRPQNALGFCEGVAQVASTSQHWWGGHAMPQLVCAPSVA